MLQAFADDAMCRVVRRVIRLLQGLDSGHDVGSIWNAVCVQAQGDEWVHWSLFEEQIESSTENELSRLPQREVDLLWLQTDEGGTWLSMAAEAGTAVPSHLDDIAKDVYMEILARASDWSNKTIRGYLNQ